MVVVLLWTFLGLFTSVLSAGIGGADNSTSVSFAFVRWHRRCGHFCFFSLLFCPLPSTLRTFLLQFTSILSAAINAADISTSVSFDFVRWHRRCGHFCFFSLFFCPLAPTLRTFLLLFPFLLSAGTDAADISTSVSYDFVRWHRFCGHFTYFSLRFCPLAPTLRTFLLLFPSLLSAGIAPADISTSFPFTFVRCHQRCGHFTYFSLRFCPLASTLRTFHLLFPSILSAGTDAADISGPLSRK